MHFGFLRISGDKPLWRIVMDKSYLFIFLAALLWLPVPYAHSNNKGLNDSPQLGILDLRTNDLDEDFILNLDGEWEFYWDHFYAYADFYPEPPRDNRLYVKVPSYWNSYTFKGTTLPASGYATYRLRIFLPENFSGRLGFDVPVFDDSYRLYINEHLMAGNGNPGPSESESEPGYLPERFDYMPETDTLDLIIHVSNFHHRRGGFWKSLRMGSPQEITRYANGYRTIYSLSLGVLASFGLFFLTFFILHRRNYHAFFFSMILFGIFLRLLNTGSYVSIEFWGLNWLWAIRFEYLGTFLAFGFGLWYFLNIYPDEVVKKITIVNSLVIFLAMMVILSSEARVFAYTMLYFQPAVIIFLGYYLFRSLAESIKKSRSDLFFFVAILLLILALINDILVSHSVASLTPHYIIHFAVQVFVFIQAVMIIRFWIQAFEEKERLNNEIEFINLNLEKLVDERTEKLNESMEEISRQNKQIEEKNKNLRSTLDFNHKILSIISHDLRSPVAGIFQISDFLYRTKDDPDISETLKSMRNMAESSSILIDNLLFWARSQVKDLQFNPQRVNLYEMINEVLNLYVEMARQKNISIQLKMEKELTAWCDYQLVVIILRNLISNAQKFTFEGGNILISGSTFQHQNQALLVIEDNGKGMSTEKILELRQSEKLISTYGTENEKGSGLGLKLCYELTRINKGTLKISSEEGKGTKVSLILPLKPESRT